MANKKASKPEAAAATPSRSRKAGSIERQDTSTRAFTRLNFYGMIIAGAMIVIGFLLMLGGSSTPQEFNPDIFSTRRVVVGPLIAFMGFVAMAVAIIITPRSKKDKDGLA